MTTDLGEDEKSLLGALGFGLGCLSPILIPLVFAFAVVLVDLAHGGWERASFPANLELVEILESHSEGVLREGCAFAALRLSERSARRIEAEGLAYFADQTRGRDGHALSAWRATPIAFVERADGLRTHLTVEGGNLYAVNAWNCRLDANRPLSAHFDSNESGYYASFNGGEGLLIVRPGSRTAIYLYYG